MAIFVIDYDWLSLWLKCKWQQSISRVTIFAIFVLYFFLFSVFITGYCTLLKALLIDSL